MNKQLKISQGICDELLSLFSASLKYFNSFKDADLLLIRVIKRFVFMYAKV